MAKKGWVDLSDQIHEPKPARSLTQLVSYRYYYQLASASTKWYQVCDTAHVGQIQIIYILACRHEMLGRICGVQQYRPSGKKTGTFYRNRAQNFGNTKEVYIQPTDYKRAPSTGYERDLRFSLRQNKDVSLTSDFRVLRRGPMLYCCRTDETHHELDHTDQEIMYLS